MWLDIEFQVNYVIVSVSHCLWCGGKFLQLFMQHDLITCLQKILYFISDYCKSYTTLRNICWFPRSGVQTIVNHMHHVRCFFCFFGMFFSLFLGFFALFFVYLGTIYIINK